VAGNDLTQRARRGAPGRGLAGGVGRRPPGECGDAAEKQYE